LRIYFDPSFLIPLYVEELASTDVRAFVMRSSPVVLLNELQELELKNAIRQKVMRGEITEGMATRSLRLLDDDCIAGLVQRKEVTWKAVYSRAEQLSRKLAKGRICRAFDLLHIAIAGTSSVRRFATLDNGQAELARAAELKIIELPTT
jgi:predicted nucleic acid-binding protein